MTLIDTAPQLFVGDYGTTFRVTVVERVWDFAYNCWRNQALNISNATTKEIVFLTPDGVARPRPAAFVTDGSDGLLEYVTAPGDIDQVGGKTCPWQFGGRVVRPGKDHQTTMESFLVLAGAPRPDIRLTPEPAVVTLGAPAVDVS